MTLARKPEPEPKTSGNFDQKEALHAGYFVGLTGINAGVDYLAMRYSAHARISNPETDAGAPEGSLGSRSRARARLLPPRKRKIACTVKNLSRRSAA